MIAAADELVGYGFYIDLLAGLGHGKMRRDFALGEEEARCRYALKKQQRGVISPSSVRVMRGFMPWGRWF